ncbi:hypothetical protein PLESTF_000511600 [Pleodorina starrii]|nr:hypothetical protein PLESTF_000511600 [Pleodorina starrii]
MPPQARHCSRATSSRAQQSMRKANPCAWLRAPAVAPLPRSAAAAPARWPSGSVRRFTSAASGADATASSSRSPASLSSNNRHHLHPQPPVLATTDARSSQPHPHSGLQRPEASGGVPLPAPGQAATATPTTASANSGPSEYSTTTAAQSLGSGSTWRQQQPSQRQSAQHQSDTDAIAAAAAGGSCSRRTAALALAAAAAAAAPVAGAAAAAVVDSGGGSRFTAQATSPAGQQGGAGAGGGGGGEEEAAARLPRRRTWPPVPLVPLARGLRVSKIMRGCWQLSGRHKGDPLTDRTSGGEAVSDLAGFHQAGITSLDLADNYGPAELMAGQYLRLYPHQAPATTIATKLSYLSEEEMSGASRTMVEYAVRRSLVRLGRQRLDLVQLQWAEPVRHRRWLDVLKWLADLREEGLIGHLGVCNFAVPQLATAVEAGVGLVSNQVQFSLIDRRPQLFMQKAAASYGIKLLAYGTVAGGLLADKYYGAPASKVRLDTASKQKYGLVVRQAGEEPGGHGGSGGAGGGGGWAWMQEVLEAARTVGQRHGVSASTVATAWVLHQPQVAAAIVGARNARHIRDMQAACALHLDEVDLLDLDAVWEGVPNPPTSDVYVWERGGDW